jgi:hypothetical protein
MKYDSFNKRIVAYRLVTSLTGNTWKYFGTAGSIDGQPFKNKKHFHEFLSYRYKNETFKTTYEEAI